MVLWLLRSKASTLYYCHFKKGNNSFFNFKLKSTSIPLCKPFLKNQIIEKPADCIFNFLEIFGTTNKTHFCMPNYPSIPIGHYQYIGCIWYITSSSSYDTKIHLNTPSPKLLSLTAFNFITASKFLFNKVITCNLLFNCRRQQRNHNTLCTKQPQDRPKRASADRCWMWIQGIYHGYHEGPQYFKYCGRAFK